MLDPKVVRKDFPILERRVHGDVPLVYLDSANTSQKPRAVIDALSTFYERHNANIHRAVYELAAEATEAYEGARTAMATFIGAPGGSREVVFTKSCTEAINLVARAWGGANLSAGDEIVVSEMEHHSNIIPWQMAAAASGATIVPWPITDDGHLDLDASPITARTKIVCVTAMSNVLGTVTPIAEVSRLAHEVGAVVLVDGAQRTPHLPTDVAALGCDFYTFTGHKMCGPTGSGGLWARAALLEEMPPFLGGGEMIDEVWLDRATYAEIPMKFEAGTQPFAQSVGLGAAVAYLNDLGMEHVRAHEVELTRYTLDALSTVEGLRVFGPAEPEARGAVFSFWMEDVHPHDLATIVDTDGIAVRAGHHCAQPLMRRLGVPATTRASLYVYNTTEDVDALVRALEGARERMAGGLPF